MQIGIFADTHDHLDNIRRAVSLFNARRCEYVLFAGDLVSTFAVPPLRELNCPMIACFGDNEGNKAGLYAGMSLVGTLAEPPFCIRLPDGTRILIAHMMREMEGMHGEYDVLVYAHTHRPRVKRTGQGPLQINPGETSGWTYGRPTVVILDTQSLEAEIVPLMEQLSEQPV